MKKIFAVICLLCLVSACGFEPLYAKRQNNNQWYFQDDFDGFITQQMAQISIEPIAERFGQQLRNQLLDSLTPLGEPKKPKYRLIVKLTNKTTTQQALRKDITATRERVKYKVQYNLIENGRPLVSGNSVSFVSYDILSNPYATTISQKKTEENAAKIIANDISLRLAAYFHTEKYGRRREE